MSRKPLVIISQNKELQSLIDSFSPEEEALNQKRRFIEKQVKDFEELKAQLNENFWKSIVEFIKTNNILPEKDMSPLEMEDGVLYVHEGCTHDHEDMFGSTPKKSGGIADFFKMLMEKGTVVKINRDDLDD